MVKAEVLGEVSSRCGNSSTPPPTLLDLHFPVRFVLQYGSGPPGGSGAAQAKTVLHNHSLLAHGACVEDHLWDWLASRDVRSRPSPLSLSIKAIVHLATIDN